MKTCRAKSPILQLVTAVFVLLFALASLYAQEKRHDGENKREHTPRPAAGSHESGRPARQEPQARPAPAQGPQHQSSPPTPQQAPRRSPEPHVSRPAQQRTPHPNSPQHQRDESPQRSGQQPNAPAQPAGRPGVYQPRTPAQPGNRPGVYQPNTPAQSGNRPGVYRQPNANRPPAQPAPQGGVRFGRGSERPQGGAAPRVVQTRRGDIVRHDARGRVSQVRLRSGAVVYHQPSGVRRVQVVRPGGRVVVASAPGRGYVQRTLVVHNRTIVKRTYVYGGRTYARVYRPVVYRGLTLNVYTPVRYYRPAFYMYAYNPWARPVYYRWGWMGDPWYGYYGGYFTPYPVYASPALWLTDYMIAATLEEAYQERMAAAAAQQANYAAAGQAPLTPEVKQLIADEVRREVDRQRIEGQQADNAGNTAGSTSLPFADSGPHVFVAHASLAVESNGGECSIGEGDVLQMNGAPPLDATTADVTILASRGQDCPKGARAAVPLQDLQEMQNHMQETIERGLGDLQARQGQSGLPALPQGAAGTIDTPLAAEARPDSNVGGELAAATREADREEQTVNQSLDAGAAGPVTISLGQTIEQVMAIQGDPQKIVDLGAKKIYVYSDIKITFTDGKVSDVQ